MKRKPIIHLIDDDDAFCTALLRLLKEGGYCACRYSSTGDFLLRLPEEGPGCIVLDVQMPGPSGLELQPRLKQLEVYLPVIFLTGHADVSSSVRAIKAGAADFLEKPIEREKLFAAIEQALSLDAASRDKRDRKNSMLTRYATLTLRERQVLDAVVSGELNKQIGSELGIAERTVKLERAKIMEKLNTDSISELIQFVTKLRSISSD